MAIELIQSTTATATSASTILSFTAATTARNTLIIALTHTASGLLTISDTASNTWVLAGSSVNATPAAATGAYQVDVWYCLHAQSITSVSIANSSSNSGVFLAHLSEISGVSAVGTSAVGYSATPTSTPTTLSINYSSGNLLYGSVAFTGSGQTATVVGSNVLEAMPSSGTNFMAISEQITNASGASGPAYTFNSASAWGQVVVEFIAIVTARDGTYMNNSYGITDISSFTHVINFGFTPTAGNFLVVFVAAATPFSTVSRWTQVVNDANQADIDYYYTTAIASQTSITVIETLQSNGIHPVAWAAYEFPAGTTITNYEFASNNNTGFPVLGSLPGTKQLILAALCAPLQSTTSTGAVTWASPWTMDFNQYHSSYAASPNSAGMFLTIAHQNNVTATSITPSGATFSFSGSQISERETMVIAFAIPAAANDIIKINGLSPTIYRVGSSIPSALYLGAVQLWSHIIPIPYTIGSASATEKSYGANSGPSISTPGNTQVGDVTIIVGYVEPVNQGTASASFGTFTLPSGVTLATGFPIETDAAQRTTGNDHRMYIWYQYATSAGSTLLAFSNTQNLYWWGLAAVTVRGGPTYGNPFADTPVTATTSRSATGVTATPPVSLTTSGSNSLVLWAYTDWDIVNTSYPNGFSDAVHGSDAPTIAIKIYNSAGSTGVVTVPRSGADNGMAAALLSMRAP